VAAPPRPPSVLGCLPNDMTPATPTRSFGQWKILLISPRGTHHAELTPFFSEFLPFSQITEMKEYPTRQNLGDTLQANTINLCFIDVSSNREWAVGILADLANLDSKLPIVALHDGNDSDFILRCLRQGASEFLVSPIGEDQFVPMMERVSAKHRSNRGGGAQARLIVTLPAKGACGASTISAALAVQLRRSGAKRVLLVDLDPLAGTISFQLKLRPTYSFMDAITRAGTLDADIWKGMVYSVQGIDVLPAPEKPVHGIDEMHDTSTVLDFARSNYDVVVADSGTAYGNWALNLARQSDDLLLITTNEIPALQSAQRVLTYLDRHRVDRSRIHIVVSRFQRDIGLSLQVIEAALHTDVYHTVPADPESIQKALVDGRQPATGSPFGRSIAQLADHLNGKEASPAAAPPKSSGLASLFSFFRK